MISDVFEGLRPVARQQRVYAPLGDLFAAAPYTRQYHREDTLAGRLRWTTFKSAAERRYRVVYLFRGRRMQRSDIGGYAADGQSVHAIECASPQ